MTSVSDVADARSIAEEVETWTAVCSIDAVQPDRGVAVLVRSIPIAIFRLSAIGDDVEEWRAVSHVDPFTASPVIARGLVGSTGCDLLTIPTVASPLYKQRFNLRTGYCLDDETVRLETYAVRVNDGFVEVAVTTCPAADMPH